MNEKTDQERQPAAPPGESRRGVLTGGDALRLTVVALLVIAVASAVWWVRNVVLLLFAGVLLGVVFHAASARLARVTHLPRRLALALMLVLVLVLAGGLVWQAGPVLAAQFEELLNSIAQTAETVMEMVAGPAVLGNLDWEDVAGVIPSPWGIATGATALLTGVLGAITSVALVFIFAVFFAATPEVYTRLALRVAPATSQDAAREMLEEAGYILRWWFKGQLAAMIVVGLLTYLGLLFLGMPFAMPLGLFAGLTNFIPYIGPFISGIAILLVAIGEGTTMAIWALGLYVVIQSFESGLLVPMIQSRAVHLPPVLVISSQLVFGVIFGILGIMLATPIAAAASVPLRRVFNREPA